MAALAAAYAVVSILATALVTGLFTPRISIVFPIVLTAGMAALGVAYFVTMAGREARHGMMVGLLLVFTYPPVVTVVRFGLDISLPTPWSLVPGTSINGLGRLNATAIPFPYASMAGWLLFALSLPFLAQLLFDRAEV